MTQRFTQYEQELLYRKFSNSQQEKLRLMIALEEITSGAPLPKEVFVAYRAYLQQRQRPAKELLRQIEGDAFWSTETGGSIDLWEQVRQRLTKYFPHFASAFSVLHPQFQTKETVGCDGQYLYCPQSWANGSVYPDFRELCRLYVHMVLHCFFGHMLRQKDRSKALWNLACDIYVEYVLRKDFPSLFFPTLPEQLSRLVLGKDAPIRERAQMQTLEKLAQAIGPLHEEKLYAYFLRHPAECQTWLAGPSTAPEGFCPSTEQNLFSRDSHAFWKKFTYPPNEQCRDLTQLLKISNAREQTTVLWSRIRKQNGSPQNAFGPKAGQVPGGEIQRFSIQPKEKVYDYRRFLDRFTISGEELQVDLENFDYIPYMYSRQYYEKLVFLEPLEYSQVQRLRELVIAIDTSGSCRGSIVRRFLEETYQIVTRRENFFRHMRVHLIQCDSMIQDYICIQNLTQWQEVAGTFEARGLGGTDFRPVFSFVEKLRTEKKILQLQGLIYFTDGDGIYPTKAPDYETAFVFLNQELEKGKIPAWAWRLNLHMPLPTETKDSHPLPQEAP